METLQSSTMATNLCVEQMWCVQTMMEMDTTDGPGFEPVPH